MTSVLDGLPYVERLNRLNELEPITIAEWRSLIVSFSKVETGVEVLNPDRLCLGICGELSEVFDDLDGLSKDDLASELSDVLIYCFLYINHYEFKWPYIDPDRQTFKTFTVDGVSFWHGVIASLRLAEVQKKLLDGESPPESVAVGYFLTIFRAVLGIAASRDINLDAYVRKALVKNWNRWQDNYYEGRTA